MKMRGDRRDEKKKKKKVEKPQADVDGRGETEGR